MGEKPPFSVRSAASVTRLGDIWTIGILFNIFGNQFSLIWRIVILGHYLGYLKKLATWNRFLSSFKTDLKQILKSNDFYEKLV